MSRIQSQPLTGFAHQPLRRISQVSKVLFPSLGNGRRAKNGWGSHVQDWFKDVQSKSRVRSAVESVLHTHLPDSYDRAIFTEKCNSVFEVMLNYATQGLKWAA